MVFAIACLPIKRAPKEHLRSLCIDPKESMDLKKFFFPRYHPPVPPVKIPTYETFMGAGCVFTDGNHVLAGYQPHKKYPCISGIGGHTEQSETYLQTAYRETIEELFDVKEIPIGLLDTLIRKMAPKHISIKKGYVLVRFTFQDLEKFLKLCRKANLQSPLYSKIPKNLLQLIQRRGQTTTSEISALCLLPIVKHTGKPGSFVHPAFVSDLSDMASS
jgi:hypothetical protein